MVDYDMNDWGKYAPSEKISFLQILIKLGFGRGAIRKKILSAWRQKYGNLVDVKVRGINYRLNLSDNVTDGKIFASSLIYDKVELAYLIEAMDEGVFVDIGANSGYYSLTLAKEAGCKVLAIEPNPVTLHRLNYNVEINAKLKALIDVIPIGIGEDGEFDLHFGESLGSASLNKALISDVHNVARIRTQPLMNLIHAQGIKKIDALKIDIEGAEDRALVPFFRTAAKNFWPKCIVMEDVHHQMWRIDLNDILRKSGYKLTQRCGGNAIFHRLT